MTSHTARSPKVPCLHLPGTRPRTPLAGPPSPVPVPSDRMERGLERWTRRKRVDKGTDSKLHTLSPPHARGVSGGTVRSESVPTVGEPSGGRDDPRGSGTAPRPGVVTAEGIPQGRGNEMCWMVAEGPGTSWVGLTSHHVRGASQEPLWSAGRHKDGVWE